MQAALWVTQAFLAISALGGMYHFLVVRRCHPAMSWFCFAILSTPIFADASRYYGPCSGPCHRSYFCPHYLDERL